jgi:hypothetical protein
LLWLSTWGWVFFIRLPGTIAIALNEKSEPLPVRFFLGECRKGLRLNRRGCPLCRHLQTLRLRR